MVLLSSDAPAVSFGSASPEHADSGFPGPGHYGTPLASPVFARSAAAVFGSEVRKSRCRPSPGPGTYATPSARRGDMHIPSARGRVGGPAYSLGAQRGGLEFPDDAVDYG